MYQSLTILETKRLSKPNERIIKSNDTLLIMGSFFHKSILSDCHPVRGEGRSADVVAAISIFLSLSVTSSLTQYDFCLLSLARRQYFETLAFDWEQTILLARPFIINMYGCLPTFFQNQRCTSLDDSSEACSRWKLTIRSQQVCYFQLAVMLEQS